MVFPLAPRPRLPRTRLGPKCDSSTSTSPSTGEARSQSSAMRSRTRRVYRFTVLRLRSVSLLVFVASRSRQNSFKNSLNLASEILMRMTYGVFELHGAERRISIFSQLVMSLNYSFPSRRMTFPKNTAPVAVPIHDLLSARWSPVAFDPAPLTNDEVHSLFEAARWHRAATTSSHGDTYTHAKATKVGARWKHFWSKVTHGQRTLASSS